MPIVLGLGLVLYILIYCLGTRYAIQNTYFKLVHPHITKMFCGDLVIALIIWFKRKKSSVSLKIMESTVGNGDKSVKTVEKIIEQQVPVDSGVIDMKDFLKPETKEVTKIIVQPPVETVTKTTRNTRASRRDEDDEDEDNINNEEEEKFTPLSKNSTKKVSIKEECEGGICPILPPKSKVSDYKQITKTKIDRTSKTLHQDPSQVSIDSELEEYDPAEE